VSGREGRRSCCTGTKKKGMADKLSANRNFHRDARFSWKKKERREASRCWDGVWEKKRGEKRELPVPGGRGFEKTSSGSAPRFSRAKKGKETGGRESYKSAGHKKVRKKNGIRVGQRMEFLEGKWVCSFGGERRCEPESGWATRPKKKPTRSFGFVVGKKKVGG